MNRKLHSLVVGSIAGLSLLLAGCDQASSDQASESSSGKQVLQTSASSAADTSDERAAQASRDADRTPERRSTAATAGTAAQASDEPAAAGEPKLELATTEHDFGKIHSREPLVVQIPFKNVGTRTLHISRISTSCGCTTTKLEKMKYEPGEGNEIEVTYKPNATGKRTRKMVTIQSNDPENPVQRIGIAAWLIEPARLEPRRLQVGQVKSGEEHRATFTIISPDIDLEVMDIKDESGLLSFDVKDDSKPEDPTFPGRKILHVAVSKQAPTGKLALPFKVTTKAAVDTDQEPIETVLDGIILGHVRGDLMTEPRFLRVRNVDRNEDFEVKTLLYAESGQPFEVTSAEFEDSMLDDVSVTFERADRAETGRDGWWIVLTGNTGNTVGAFRGTIVVDTNLETEGPKKVQYNGVIRRTVPITRTSPRRPSN